MGEIGATSSLSPYLKKVGTLKDYNGYGRRRWLTNQHHGFASSKSCKQQQQVVLIKNQMAVNKPDTYSSRISTDIPLYESPGASFDRYLEDKPRVFEAIFPDKRRSQQRNEVVKLDQLLFLKQGASFRRWTSVYHGRQECYAVDANLSLTESIKEEWRIQMLPINFLFLTVWPVVDMRLRCKSGGEDYPADIPRDITKVLELDITRWQLEGLDNVIQPSHFNLRVRGALYPDRRGARTRLKGQLEMNMSFVLPPVLSIVPEDVRKNVAETVLTRLVENMKHKVNGSLLTDYSEFKREKPKHRV